MRKLYKSCLNDAAYEFLYIWIIGSREEELLYVFPCTSLCKM